MSRVWPALRHQLRDAVRAQPVLWLLAAVPTVFIAERVAPEAHRALFVLSILAIIPLAGLLSHATESVAARVGDTLGGLLNATLGNMTELVISIAALRAGMGDLVKASIAGAIVTNSLFMLGTALVLGGLKYRVQRYNPDNARLQAGMLFLASVALLVPSALGLSPVGHAGATMLNLSIGLSMLLLLAYVLSLVYSLGTHRAMFEARRERGDPSHEQEDHWPVSVAVPLLGLSTLLVALVSEIFVGTVQRAASAFGMSPAFVGFIVVALVGAAAEMTAAFSAARKNRLDLAVGIALGSSSQIALFVAPLLLLLGIWIAPGPIDLHFSTGAIIMVIVSTLTVFLVANSGRSTWFIGVMLLVVYATFAMTLYVLPAPG